MHYGTFILCCAFFSSIAAFNLPENDSDNPISNFMNDGCQCKNGRCVKDNRGKTKCNCKRGYALQDEHTCELCDCGNKGKCMFVGLSESSGGFKYIKKCLCDLGSAEKDGLCVDCQCGENSKCEFEDGEKVCYCIEGYAEKEGVCTNCDCGPDGECTFKNGQKICTCDEDFVEINSYCTHKCDLLDCKNGGSCKIENAVAVCECHERFKGNECEIDKCNAVNCQNGGTCEIRNGEPVCKCLERFTGDDCLTDKCTMITCLNGGVCSIHRGQPVCNCSQGYYGKECEIDECSRTTCYNGGKCYMSNGKALCQCYARYEGDRCEKDKCLKLNCRNNGSCAIKNGNAVCDCPERFEGKDCEIDKCMRLTCKNNGRCAVQNGNAICDCPERFEGRDCEIDKCGYLDCQNGGKCAIKDRKAYCECTPKYMGEKCEKPTCSIYYPCQNGGYCREGTCECLRGTSGGFCDVIDDCPNLCPQRSDINCTYDVKYQRAHCECLDQKLGFYPDTKECKRTCGESGCENGGTCDYVCAYADDCVGYSRFCNCLEGTNGDFCENVPDCQGMNCGMESTCQYDAKWKKAHCQCLDRNLILDHEDHKCKKPCRQPSDCKNGGTCVTSLTPDLGYCRCLNGTKGDFCEEVPGCFNKECGYNAKCEYDVERKIAMCKCVDENFAYDPVDLRCKKSCIHDSLCRNGGLCMPRGHSRFCHCQEGTSGDFCEEVDVCNKLCGMDAGVVCKYDLKQKIVECTCADEKYEFDTVTKSCKPCDCGGKEISCNVKGGRKTCICPDGYVDKNGKCKKQSCTDKKCKNGKCEVINDQEVCSCFEGFFLDGDKCKKKKFCDPNPCFKGAKCKDRHENSCYCEKGTYYHDKQCKKLEANTKCSFSEYEETCSCPKDTKRPRNARNCYPRLHCRDRYRDYGYGICTRNRMPEPDSIECFSFAEFNAEKGKCVLKKGFCPGEQLEDSLMKCKCEGQFKHDKNGITCTLKTCDDDDVKKQCKKIGADCKMYWKGKGYSCCPKEYEEDENGECIDRCSSIVCQNGGKCEIKNGKAACTCTDKYTGDYCETDKCSLLKCQNGGTCYIRNKKAVCTCDNKYSGDLCEIGTQS